MHIIVVTLAVWFLISIVVGLLFGRILALSDWEQPMSSDKEHATNRAA
jgi:putative solute:sodium symporter small subunit